MLNRTLLVSAAAWALALASSAHAQSTGAPQSAPPTPGQAAVPTVSEQDSALADIVVTAQRRSENLQNVPVTVTAVTAAQLSGGGVQNTQDLVTVVPGLTFPSNHGSALPHLRGIGNTAIAPGLENSIALYVDGVYYATSAGSILTLNNVDQIEVLKGPQGTLFGRNATGGLIQITTKDPTQELSGHASIGYGNYNTLSTDVYLGGGLTNTLAVDFAGQYNHQGDGYGVNLYNGKDVYRTEHDLSLRSKIVWKPGDRTEFKLALDFERTDSTNGVFVEIPGTQSANPFYNTRPSLLFQPDYDINQNVQPAANLRGGGANLHINQELGFARLVSITAFRKSTFYFTVDPDVGPESYLDVYTNQRDAQVSQELQLQSAHGGPFQWTLGAFYFHAKDEFDPLNVILGGAAASPIGGGRFLTGVTTMSNQKTDSVAGYGQATYAIAPRTNVTLGVRLTYERKELLGNQTGHVTAGPARFDIPFGVTNKHFSVTKPTWRIAIDHKFTPDVLGYISYNRGFKTGGYNLNVPSLVPYETEQLDAYEAGLKTELLDRHLRINGSVFYYDYSNIQVSRFFQGNAEVYNGAKATMYGADLDIDAAVSDHLKLTAGFELLHTNFKSFPCADYYAGGANTNDPACSASAVPTLPYMRSATGHDLPDAPKLTASVGADYSFDLGRAKGDLVVDDAINSGYYSEPNNQLHQGAYNVLNASLTLTDASGRSYIRFWTKNLADTRYSVQLTASPDSLSIALAPPRTFGATVGTKF